MVSQIETSESSGEIIMTQLNLINYANLLAYIANVLVTYSVGNGVLPGAQSNSELSDKYQTLVTPAGYAFAIWGIIFLSQAIFTVAQLLPSVRAVDLVQKGVGWNYVFVCLAQIVWSFVFAYEYIEVSVVAMITILIFLVRTVLSQIKVVSNEDELTTSTRDYWLLQFPFSIHCGWITAASFVNISVVAVKLQASATVQFCTAIASLVTLLLIAGVALFYGASEYVIPSVLVWATVSYSGCIDTIHYTTLHCSHAAFRMLSCSVWNLQ
jgi:benzodiazapine receptor